MLSVFPKPGGPLSLENGDRERGLQAVPAPSPCILLEASLSASSSEAAHPVELPTAPESPSPRP